MAAAATTRLFEAEDSDSWPTLAMYLSPADGLRYVNKYVVKFTLCWSSVSEDHAWRTTAVSTKETHMTNL
ncbi:hypothetical protein M404DRAFT_992508 [Pisolithus tinctorius Marx 270]|uniref:Uncharacterized protein n=1 Tax=Pisolithus tinctorius Marx 270 TaxID=870435 RepID=A0A0C3JYM8_PISTI|nr:hypothetical protein M404DRAFT_992508 [Pisolithus tinctorius Marx 270]